MIEGNSSILLGSAATPAVPLWKRAGGAGGAGVPGVLGVQGVLGVLGMPGVPPSHFPLPLQRGAPRSPVPSDVGSVTQHFPRGSLGKLSSMFGPFSSM